MENVKNLYILRKSNFLELDYMNYEFELYDSFTTECKKSEYYKVKGTFYNNELVNIDIPTILKNLIDNPDILRIANFI